MGSFQLTHPVLQGRFVLLKFRLHALVEEGGKPGIVHHVVFQMIEQLQNGHGPAGITLVKGGMVKIQKFQHLGIQIRTQTAQQIRHGLRGILRAGHHSVGQSPGAPQTGGLGGIDVGGELGIGENVICQEIQKVPDGDVHRSGPSVVHHIVQVQHGDLLLFHAGEGSQFPGGIAFSGQSALDDACHGRQLAALFRTHQSGQFFGVFRQRARQIRQCRRVAVHSVVGQRLVCIEEPNGALVHLQELRHGGSIQLRAQRCGLQKGAHLGEGGDLIIGKAPVGVCDKKIQCPFHRQSILPGGGKKTVYCLLAQRQSLSQHTGGEGVSGRGGRQHTGQEPDLLHLIGSDVFLKHRIGIQLACHEADELRRVVGGIGTLSVHHPVQCPQHLSPGAFHAQDRSSFRRGQRPGEVLRIRQCLKGRQLSGGIRRDHGTEFGIRGHFLREKCRKGGKGHGHGRTAGMPDGVILQ